MRISNKLLVHVIEKPTSKFVVVLNIDRYVLLFLNPTVQVPNAALKVLVVAVMQGRGMS